MRRIILLALFVAFSSTAYANEPSLSEVLEWKYGPVAGTRQADPNDTSSSPKMVISSWNSDVSQPDEKQIEADTEEYKAFLTQKEQADQSEIDNIKTKLKLTDDEIDALKKALS